MAKKTIQVNIAEPCHEDWNKMTTTQCGAFCKACQKEVIDFTNKSEAQIVEILSETKGKVCGRFTADKLDKPLSKYEPDQEWYSWKKWAIAAGVLLGVGNISADWIDTNPNAVPVIQNKNLLRTMGEPAVSPVVDTTNTLLKPVANDSLYTGIAAADTSSIAVKTQCTRLIKQPAIDTSTVLIGDTTYSTIDTAEIEIINVPEVTMGLVAPVIMGKIAPPQKEKKPKKDR